jgi:hypothetical protein
LRGLRAAGTGKAAAGAVPAGGDDGDDGAPEGVAAAPGGAGGASMEAMIKNAVATDEDTIYQEEFRLKLTNRYLHPDTYWSIVSAARGLC